MSYFDFVDDAARRLNFRRFHYAESKDGPFNAAALDAAGRRGGTAGLAVRVRARGRARAACALAGPAGRRPRGDGDGDRGDRHARTLHQDGAHALALRRRRLSARGGVDRRGAHARARSSAHARARSSAHARARSSAHARTHARTHAHATRTCSRSNAHVQPVHT
eukprot:1773112-Pleurochrysis_carterae.AAC.1